MSLFPCPDLALLHPLLRFQIARCVPCSHCSRCSSRLLFRLWVSPPFLLSPCSLLNLLGPPLLLLFLYAAVSLVELLSSLHASSGSSSSPVLGGFTFVSLASGLVFVGPSGPSCPFDPI